MTMNKFQVAGQSLHSQKVYLTLPVSKHFTTNGVQNEELEMRVEDLLNIAVTRKKSELYHISPVVWKDSNYNHNVPRTLHHILTKHPYPLSQGPVMLPNDCLTTEKFEKSPISKSASDVMKVKTVFCHDDTQECYQWQPMNSGVSVWKNKGIGYKVTALSSPGLYLDGPMSTMSMGVLYTGNLSRCRVFCPCTICKDERKTCKRLCRVEVCKQCNAQCTQHVIKLPRIFSANTDHYTMVTDMMTKYRHAYPYAGIPLSCVSCTRDVEEHQLLHLVWHVRCRFCRFEMRPFEQKSVVSMEDFKTAENILRSIDGKTCSFCLVQSHDSYARKKHEERVHRNEAGKYKCDQCHKTFSNENALKYHTDHHANLKIVCDLCGFQSSSTGNLEKHKLVHNVEVQEGIINNCYDCNLNFSNKNNLKRHSQEVHYGNKKNLDFVEDFDDMKTINCEKCGEKFKRTSHLKRHENSVHNSNTRSFQCPSCDKTFPRKDNLNRHIKSQHKEEESV